MVSEIAIQIQAYLDSKISLSELEDWEAARLPELIANPYSREADLAAAIELCLAEYADNLRDEKQVREYLNLSLNNQTIHKSIYQPKSPIISTISSSLVINRMYQTQAIIQAHTQVRIIQAG